MASTRYGILVKPFGYVCSSDAWGHELEFTQDATKAALKLSYSKKEDALEFIARNAFTDVQVAIFDVRATVTFEAADKAKEDVQAARLKEFGAQLADYQQKKALYDCLTAKELDEIPNEDWRSFKYCERQLRLLELI